MFSNYLKNGLLLALLVSSSSNLSAFTIEQISGAEIWKYERHEFGTNWGAFAGSWSGAPAPGCVIFGPYATIDVKGIYSPRFAFSKFNIGSNTTESKSCKKRNIFKQCTDEHIDRRSRPGTVRFDMNGDARDGRGTRVLWGETYGGERGADLPRFFSGYYGFPSMTWVNGVTALELRVCNFEGVTNNNTQIEFTGGDITVTYL